MRIQNSSWTLAGGIVAVAFISLLAASIAGANGVNPPRTKANTPVDIECKKSAADVVAIKNAFIASADAGNASREIEFMEGESGATMKLFLIDIKSLDISSVPKEGDFAPARITNARQPNRGPTEGKIRIRKDGAALVVRGDESVPLQSCRTLVVRGPRPGPTPAELNVPKN